MNGDAGGRLAHHGWLVIEAGWGWPMARAVRAEEA